MGMTPKVSQSKTTAKKPADLRLILPSDIAVQLRERADKARRTLQAQAIMDIERGMRSTNP
jgi:hypothetical protein